MIGWAGALALLAATFLGAAGQEAQTQAPRPAIRIQAGTPISIRLIEQVRARGLKPGMTLALRVTAPLTAEGCVIIPQAAPVEMLVVEASAAAIAGQPDHLSLRAFRVRDFRGSWIPLDGEYSITGEDRSLESIGAAATVSCLFLAMKGDPVVLAAGTGWVAFIGATQTYAACQ